MKVWWTVLAIDIKNLNFSYVQGAKILDNINLQVKKGDFIVLVGGNGSGKSTLIKNMLNELEPDTGTIEILGKDISSYKSFKKIGYVPQMSVMDEVAFPITTREIVSLNLYEDFGFFKFPKKRHREKTDKILKDMGLEEYYDTPINELSGGLKQRTMIARGMINEPELLILDEPTTGIDQENRESFLRTLDELNRNEEMTLVLVTHNIEEAVKFVDVDKVYEIVAGSLREVEAC